MAFKLSSLLNPASPSPQPQEQAPSNTRPASENVSRPSQQPATAAGASLSSDLDAAQALTAFATASSYSNGRATAFTQSSLPQYSAPTGFDAQVPASYPSATPVEPVQPSPPVLQQPFSPTLEQYHHKSKSPEEQRRESFATASRNSPPTILAPLQNYAQPIPSQDISKAESQPNNLAIPRGSREETNDTTRQRESDSLQNASTLHSIQAPTEVSGLGIETGDGKRSYNPKDVVNPSDRTPSNSNPHSPSDQLRFESQAASSVQIKEEPTTSEPNSAPLQSPVQDNPPTSLTGEGMDEETKKAIEKLRNDDLGLRGARTQPQPQPGEKIAQSIETPLPQTTTSSLKKRPAPRTTAANKKGMAKKPPTKKRKTLHERNIIEGTDQEGASTVARGKANGGIKNGTKSNSTTPAPPGSSPAEHVSDDDDEEEDDDDGSDSGQLYCVCRKPDNHTWMIACDGCEDWFHGECVQMTPRDGELISQYYCASCSDAGKGRTLWKPMCRRKGCGRPANLEINSKYCSDDCGKLFFKELITETRREQRAAEKGSEFAERWRTKEVELKERRRANRADQSRNPFDSDSEAEARPGARGGVIRPGELKTLVNSTKTAQEFHALGEQLRSPPPSLSPESRSAPAAKDHKTDTHLLPTEIERIKAIEEEKEKVRVRRALLKDREKFMAMTKDMIPVHAEREGVKPKDFCGYDSRHAWSEEEFRQWRESATGKRAFRLGTLDPGAKTPDPDASSNHNAADKMDVDSEENLWSGSVCPRKRCTRHVTWQKVAREDILFEIQTCATAMRALDAEEKGIRERSLERYRKEPLPISTS